MRTYLCPPGNYPSIIEEDADGEHIQSSVNLDEVRDEPVEYGNKAQKRKRRENIENDPPTGMIAKKLFGPPVFSVKDPFSEK